MVRFLAVKHLLSLTQCLACSCDKMVPVKSNCMNESAYSVTVKRKMDISKAFLYVKNW